VDGYASKPVKGSRVLYENNVLSDQKIIKNAKAMKLGIFYFGDKTTNIRLLILINNIFVFPIYFGEVFLSFFFFVFKYFRRKFFSRQAPTMFVFFSTAAAFILIPTVIIEAWSSAQSVLIASGATVAIGAIAPATTISRTNSTKKKAMMIKTTTKKLITKKINHDTHPYNHRFHRSVFRGLSARAYQARRANGLPTAEKTLVR
jgi:hypothetical protein